MNAAGTWTIATIGILGYLIGSIPFAYLITRARTGKDLRIEGTGNIGTANALDVTGSKTVGLMVLIADVLKGTVPVFLLEIFHRPESIVVLVPALILGHCYPVWLRFHGGRGLATIAGTVLPINPAMILLWLAVYMLARKIKDHVHFGAILATGCMLAVVLLAPMKVLAATTLSFSGLLTMMPQFALSILVSLVIILSRHIEPLMVLLKERRL